MFISILRIVKSTSVDGVGLRTSIYCSGCSHHCLDCQNPQSWNIENGNWMEIEDIVREIEEDGCKGVTFTGGDPFFQVEGFIELAKEVKAIKKNIWCYTGYRYEELITNERFMELMRFIDVLVDGRFEKELKEDGLLFRGSRNQRLIDVQKSLIKSEVILFENK